MKFMTQLACGLTLLALSFASYSEDRLDMEGTAIIGSRELPKALYIVPWKKSELDPLAQSSGSVADDMLTPVDKDVFERQLRFHQMLNPPPSRIQ